MLTVTTCSGDAVTGLTGDWWGEEACRRADSCSTGVILLLSSTAELGWAGLDLDEMALFQLAEK